MVLPLIDRSLDRAIGAIIIAWLHATAVRRRLSPVTRPRRKPIAGLDRPAHPVDARNAAAPRRWRSSTAPRPRSSQRQSRVPYAADADARPARGALAFDVARSAERRTDRAPQRAALLKLVNTLLDFSRFESGRAVARLRTDRSRCLHRGPRQHVPLRDRARRAGSSSLARRCPGRYWSTATCGRRSS